MEGSSSTIQEFFKEYERNSSRGNVDALVSQFADMFMLAGPQGSQLIPAAAFASALPKRIQMFAEMGCHSTELVSLRETPLNNQYVLAETQWRMKFTRPEKCEEIIAASTFIVHAGEKASKIVFYLPHQDIMLELKNRGLLNG